MDDRDQDGHAEICIDEGACCLVPLVEIGSAAETKKDGYERQSGAMRNRHHKRPKADLCRWYPRQHSRMAPVYESEGAEPNDQEAGANLDLSLQLDNSDQQREREDHNEHRQYMADR
jgi:hypothetical protein